MSRKLLLVALLLSPSAATAQAVTTATRAAERCAMCGELDLLAALEALLAADTDESRIVAIEALGRTGSPLSLEALRYQVSTGSGPVRRAAVASIASLDLVETLEDLLDALEDSDPEVRTHAALGLGAFPLTLVRQRLQAVAAAKLELLTARVAAVEALLEHDTREARAAADSARATSTDLFTATASASDNRKPPCDQCFEPKVTLALSTLLASSDPRLRAAALLDVDYLRPATRGLSIFVRATRDPDRRVRAAGLGRVVTSTETKAADLLVEMTVRSPHRDVRVDATRGLFERSEPIAAAHLVALVRHADPDLGSVVLATTVATATVSDAMKDAAFVAASNSEAQRDLRQIAMRVVAEHKHGEAVSLLTTTANTADESLGRTALQLLQKHYPADYEAFMRGRPSSSARGWLIGSSAVFGGAAFGLLGGIRDESLGLSLLSAGGGLVLGGGSAFLLTIGDTFTAGEVGLFTTDGTWGLMMGLGSALAIAGDEAGGGLKLGGALGTAAGVGIGALSMRSAEWTMGDSAFINVSGAQASLGTLGLLMMPASGDDAPRALGLTLLGGTFLGVLPATLSTRKLSFTAGDAGRVVTSAAVGGWLGAWTTRLIAPDDNDLSGRTVAGALLGESLGYLTGTILSQHHDFAAGRVAWGGGLGAGLGGGLGLMAPGIGTHGSAAIMDLSTIGGAALALYAVPDDPDVWMGFTGAGIGGWFGTFLPTLHGDFSRDSMTRERGGGLLTGATAGMLASFVAFGDGRVKPRTKSLSLLGTLGGAGLGAGATLIASDEDQTVFRVMYATSALGLAAGAFGLTELEMSPGDQAAAGVAAGYGTLAGLLLPDVVAETGDRGRARWGGVFLLSSAFGLGTLAVSEVIDPAPGDAVEIALYGAAGAAVGDGLLTLVEANDQARAIATLSASGLALASGLAFAGDTDFDTEDRLLLAGSSITFGALGAGLPFLRREVGPPARDVVAGVELGAGLGLGLGILAHKALDRSAADIGETTLFTGAGGALGLGLGLMIPDSSKPVKAALYETGAVAFGATMLALSPRTEYDGLSATTVSLLTTYGAWSGAWLPYLYNGDDAPPAEQIAGGVLFGAGVGAAGGVLLTQGFDLKPRAGADVVETALGGVASNMVGAGIGLIIPGGHNAPVVGFMEGFGLLGTAGVAALAPSTDFTAGDTTVGLLVTSQALWNGVGAAFLLDATDRQKAGFALTAAGLGGLGGAALSQYVDESATTALLSFTGSVWGTWLGYFGAQLAEQWGLEISEKGVLGATLITSDIGLLLSAIAVSPLVDMAPARVGWINIGGLSGALVGSTVGLIADGKNGANAGNVLGGAVGLLTSTIVTAFFDFDTAAPVAEAPKKVESASLPRRGGWMALLPEVSDLNVGSSLLEPVDGEAPPMVLSVSGRLR